MPETEGVIKYHLTHDYIPLAKHINIAELNAWRTVLHKLNLIGQIDDRYDGYGFGNISQRLTLGDSKKVQFVISGTQTGDKESLSKNYYCTILEAFPVKNQLKSAGEIKPSSESLTHASIYQQNTAIQSVVHIHNHEIWSNTKNLKLAYTSENIEYGTPEMANEVCRLFETEKFVHTGVFSMLGHVDGIIAFSDSIEQAAEIVIKLYVKALIIEQQPPYR